MMDLLLELGEVVERSVRSATSKSGIFVVDEQHRLKRQADDRSLNRALGEFFVEEAQAEEAAVERWEALVDELRALAAPRTFIEYCSAASLSALRHAKELSMAARDHGEQPLSTKVSQRPERELHQLAVENAVYGCIESTFRAVRLRHQVETARNAKLVRILSDLAADESRHAGFYWELQRWALGQISPQRGRDVRAAQLAGIRRLRDSSELQGVDEFAEELGLPDADTRKVLLDVLDQELWQTVASR